MNTSRNSLETYAVDLLVINGENAAGGFGITPSHRRRHSSILGAQVITTGNHIWDKKEIFDYMKVPSDSHARGRRHPASRKLRGSPCPASASTRALSTDGQTYAVINMQGRVFMSSL